MSGTKRSPRSSSAAREAAPGEIAAREIAPRLIDWHERHQRLLPWRDHRAGVRDAYRVWVAEVMLQQTRVAVVQEYYLRWMERFPSLEALAAAPIDAVLRQWQGLGYYARARNLQRSAQIVVEEYAGRLPATRAELLRLPGVGEYSAGAILSLAYGQAEPLLDGNVKRVLTRLADVAEPVEAGPTLRHLWVMARELVESAPVSEAGVLNEALIELGALLCTPRSPRCDECPLADLCLARARGTQLQRPMRRPRKQTPHFDVVAGIIWQGEPGRSRLLIAQRPHEGLLGGLWEFPGGKVEATDGSFEAALVREIEEELAMHIDVGEAAIAVDHAFTHFRITLHSYHARHVSGEPVAVGCAAWRWVRVDELEGYAMGAADRRVVAHLRLDNAPGPSAKGRVTTIIDKQKGSTCV